jgi:cobalamin biosynthesis protein CobD/CbiB
MQTAIYVPPGWPESVRPPVAADWEQSATAYLLDCCPADFRGYPVLRRHPVVLAGFAAQFVESQLRASQAGLAGARAHLDAHVPPHVVESAVEAWQEQIANLVRVRRAVALVEEALRGKVFIRKL